LGSARDADPAEQAAHAARVADALSERDAHPRRREGAGVKLEGREAEAVILYGSRHPIGRRRLSLRRAQSVRTVSVMATSQTRAPGARVRLITAAKAPKRRTRRRRALNLTLGHAARERLSRLAITHDGNISRTIEALVLAAPLPAEVAS